MCIMKTSFELQCFYSLSLYLQLSFLYRAYHGKLLQVSSQSQKFCPEAITFLQTMLMAALTNRQRYESSQVFFHNLEYEVSSIELLTEKLHLILDK